MWGLEGSPVSADCSTNTNFNNPVSYMQTLNKRWQCKKFAKIWNRWNKLEHTEYWKLPAKLPYLALADRQLRAFADKCSINQKKMLPDRRWFLGKHAGCFYGWPKWEVSQYITPSHPFETPNSVTEHVEKCCARFKNLSQGADRVDWKNTEIMFNAKKAPLW